MSRNRFIMLCAAYCSLVNGIAARDLGVPPCRVETAVEHIAGNFGVKAIFIKNAIHDTHKGFFFGKDLPETLRRFNAVDKLHPSSRIILKDGFLLFSGAKLERVLSKKSTEFKKVSISGDDPEVCDLTAEKSELIKDVINRVFKAYPRYNCCEMVFPDTQPVKDIWSGGLLATPLSANSTSIPDVNSNVITLSFESVKPLIFDSNPPSMERQIKTFLKSSEVDCYFPTYETRYLSFFHLDILRKVLDEERFWGKLPFRWDWKWDMPDILFRNNGGDPKVAEYIFDVCDKLASDVVRKEFIRMYFPDKSMLSSHLAKRMDRILSSNKSFQRAYLQTHVPKNLKWKGDDAPFDKNKPVITVPPTKVVRTSYLRLKFRKLDFFALSSDSTELNLNLLKIKEVKKADALSHSKKIGEMVYMIYTSDFTIGGVPPIRDEADIDLKTPESAYLSSLCARNLDWYSKCLFDSSDNDDPMTIYNYWGMWYSKLPYFIKIIYKVDFKYNGKHYVFLVAKYFKDNAEFQRQDDVEAYIDPFVLVGKNWKLIDTPGIFLQNLLDYIKSQLR